MVGKAGRQIVNAVTIVFLIFAVCIWGLPRIGIEPYSILTGSMEPEFTIGEIVLVDRNDQSAEEGDVIAFFMGENVVIHRVLEDMGEQGYITKGDANPTKDFCPVTRENMIGTVWMDLDWFTVVWKIYTTNAKYVVIVIMALLNIVTEVFLRKGETGDDDA